MASPSRKLAEVFRPTRWRRRVGVDGETVRDEEFRFTVVSLGLAGEAMKVGVI